MAYIVLNQVSKDVKELKMSWVKPSYVSNTTHRCVVNVKIINLLEKRITNE